jgi:hypothetical protein
MHIRTFNLNRIFRILRKCESFLKFMMWDHYKYSFHLNTHTCLSALKCQSQSSMQMHSIVKHNKYLVLSVHGYHNPLSIMISNWWDENTYINIDVIYTYNIWHRTELHTKIIINKITNQSHKVDFCSIFHGMEKWNEWKRTFFHDATHPNFLDMKWNAYFNKMISDFEKTNFWIQYYIKLNKFNLVLYWLQNMHIYKKHLLFTFYIS